MHRAPRRFSGQIALTALVFICATACGKKEEPKPEAKPAPAKAEPKPVEEAPLAPKLDLSGPLPPETSTVFFTSDGALTPIGCFDKGAGKLKGGRDCLKLLKEGDEILLSSEFGQILDMLGAPKNSMCELGEKPMSLSASKLTSGATYDWAAFPKSFGPTVEAAHSDTRSERGRKLSPPELEAISSKLVDLGAPKTTGELRSHQRVEIDIDMDKTADVLYAVSLPHATDPDRLLLSALLLAPNGDLTNLQVIEKSKKPKDIFTLRGAVDINGDGQRELWVNLTMEGGAGDRIIELSGKKPKALSGWTCGV